MYYPGQPLYFPDEKKVGIFLSSELDTRYPYEPTFYALTYIGEHGEESDICFYEVKEITPIVEPDKVSVTGQKLHYGKFARESAKQYYTKEEIEEGTLEADMLQSLKSLMSKKWFKDKYEIDLTLK
jgi:hypothetical protein